jgi:hypothetical protein
MSGLFEVADPRIQLLATNSFKGGFHRRINIKSSFFNALHTEGSPFFLPSSRTEPPTRTRAKHT